MKKNLITFLALLLMAGSGNAQEDICIGKRYTCFSDVLQEERQYMVGFPASYDAESAASSRYPVIYLVDGEMYFHALSAIQRTFARGRRGTMPECIIVGIVNTDRNRDLTPGASPYNRDGQLREDGTTTGGGAELFSEFIITELRQVIDHDFRTDGENILVGHSFGGLFTLHVMTHHTEAFDKYVALDPSLWWNNRTLAREIEEMYPMKSFEGKTLYIGVATKPRPDRPGLATASMDNLRTTSLAAAQANGLTFFYNEFPDDTHGTLPMPGMMNAFKQIYAK